jgi:hypothetical protein
MKSRKTLLYVELTDLVINQVKKIFSPNPRQIKSTVEDLIQKGYLERVPPVTHVTGAFRLILSFRRVAFINSIQWRRPPPNRTSLLARLSLRSILPHSTQK